MCPPQWYSRGLHSRSTLSGRDTWGPETSSHVSSAVAHQPEAGCGFHRPPAGFCGCAWSCNPNVNVRFEQSSTIVTAGNSWLDTSGTPAGRSCAPALADIQPKFPSQSTTVFPTVGHWCAPTLIDFVRPASSVVRVNSSLALSPGTACARPRTRVFQTEATALGVADLRRSSAWPSSSLRSCAARVRSLTAPNERLASLSAA